MPMASETFCASSQKATQLFVEQKIQNKIHHPESLNGCSCSYEHVGNSCPKETNGTLCYVDKEQDSSADFEESKAAESEDLRQENGSTTLQDLYMQDDFVDEDDDSDWEPENHFIIKKWFCYNCTMPNLVDVCHCCVCGEHKESYIGQEAQGSSDLEAVRNGDDSQPKFCTAVGFDERMLLHTEVGQKFRQLAVVLSVPANI